VSSVSSTVYLTGPGQLPEDIASAIAMPDWRCHAMSKLQRYGLQVLNPLTLALPLAEEQKARTDEGVRRSLQLIDQCDAVLANLLKPSYGAAMEIFYAYRHGKVVTVVGQKPFHPWILSHSQARFIDIDNAIDYLIDKSPCLDSIIWALQYETLLAERYEQFPPSGEPDYQFMGGDLPVMAVAPHATAYFRDGTFQEPETFTGSMAAVLNRTARCHALVTFYCCAADPCWHLETPLRRALADIVRFGEVGLLLVLLGSSWNQSPGLAVGALGPEEDEAEELASRLRYFLAQLEPPAKIEHDSISYPLFRFAARELKIPVLLIKLHKRYRMPRLEAGRFRRLVELLSDFLAETGRDLLRSRS